MKALKKLSCVLLLVLLMLSFSTTAFAAAMGDPPYTMPTDDPVTEGENYTPKAEFDIVIQEEAAGHVYNAYQIFSGDLYGKKGDSGVEEVLSNIEWGSGITAAGTNALIEKYCPDKKDATAADVADAIGKDASAADELATFLNGNPNYLNTPTQLNKSGSVYTAKVKTGYYMITDSLTGEGADLTGSAVSDYIVQVVDNVSMKPKADVPKVEKKIIDNGKPQDATFAGVGDPVTFQLKATLPGNYSTFKTYYFELQDTLSNGLTAPSAEGFTITVDGEDIKDYFDIQIDSQNITITANDLKSVDVKKVLYDNTEIIVTYNATVNENAVIGNPGNDNTVQLFYNNDPNFDGEGDPPENPGHTPKDVVVVFTFEVDVNKVQPDPAEENPNQTKPLEGAGFTLFMQVEGSEGVKEWKAFGEEITGETTFKFERLDKGFYKLEETTTPPGFNTIDPIYFTVEGKYASQIEIDGVTYNCDPPALVSLTVTPTDADGIALGEGTDKASFTYDLTRAADDDSGKLTGGGTASTDILNQSGLQLPETGGIGTTIFYTVGGVLVAVALILLVTKKRMSKEA